MGSASTPKKASQGDAKSRKHHAAALLDLAEHFRNASERRRTTPPKSFAEIMETTAWRDRAGELTAQAYRAGFISLDGLGEIVAWVDGAEISLPSSEDAPPPEAFTVRETDRPRAHGCEFTRCGENLWGFVRGSCRLPATVRDGKVVVVPELMGGLLAADPRMRPDRLFRLALGGNRHDRADAEARVEAARLDADAAACEILAEMIEGEGEKDGTGKVTWEAAQKRLLTLSARGEIYKTQVALAGQIGCSAHTVNKAIRRSKPLLLWRAEGRHCSPQAQSLSDIIADDTASHREPDPADLLPDEDVDLLFCSLVQEVSEDKQAELRKLDPEGRRDLVRLVQAQKKDMFIEDKAPKGNRILGRKA